MENHYRPTVVRSMEWDRAHPSREILLNREWLLTNGLGGYASGTVSGAITRKYHGILVAALPAPLGRVVMWNHVSEFLPFDDNEVVSLGAEERAGGQLDFKSAEYLREFRLEDGMPIWIYQVRDFVIEKRVSMPHLQNTVHVSYQITGAGKPPRLELRPAFHFRHHEDAVDVPLAEPYKLSATDERYEIASARRKFGPLRMRLCGRATAFTIAAARIHQVVYRTEQARGYAHQGELWSPGFFQVDLANEGTATLIGSTEPWDIIDVLSPAEVLAAERERRARLLEDADPDARGGGAAELVFASDQYVITHARRDPLVLSRLGTLSEKSRGPDYSAALVTDPDRHRGAPFAWDEIQHPRRSGGRSSRAGSGRLPAHLDGCEDGRLGGDAAPRK